MLRLVKQLIAPALKSDSLLQTPVRGDFPIPTVSDTAYPHLKSHPTERELETIQRLTNAQRLEMLDTHPLFTSRCPACASIKPNHRASTGIAGTAAGWTTAYEAIKKLDLDQSGRSRLPQETRNRQ